MSRADPEARVREVLSHINPNCGRERWTHVLMGVKHELGDLGFDAADEWSSKGDSYQSSTMRATWKSIKRDGGRTFATVVEFAKQEGYVPKRHAYKQLSAEEQTERDKKAATRKAKHDEEIATEHAAAAELAEEILAKSIPATGDFEYLASKRVGAHGNARIGNWPRFGEDGAIAGWFGPVLLLQMYDTKQKVHSLQGITQDGTKLFLKDGAKKGHFFPMGGPSKANDGERTFQVGEGYATAASGLEAAGVQTFHCFDLGNMIEVARRIRAAQPKAHITLLCDNDSAKPGNPGRTKATALAIEIGARLAVPPPGDMNDLHVAKGLQAVRDAIDAATVPTEPFVPPEARGVLPRSIEVAPLAKPLRKVGFGKPVDLFNLAPPEKLPLECFPASIAAYAADQAARMGCDAGIVAISATVAAASMIPDDFKIQPKRHDTEWRESPRLWAAIVGDPSTQKSPGMAAAVRHIKEAEVACGLSNKAAEADFLQRREKWKGDCAKDGKGSHPEPKPPQRRRRMVGDVTVEALSDVLADNPAGLFCFKDELSGWFGSMDAYKGGGKGGGMDRAHWLEAYNGGPRTVDRVTRGSIMVPNFSVCMLGGIQPGPMKKIAGSIDHDGLLQRFMILVARPGEQGEDRVPGAEAKFAFEHLFEQLGALQLPSKSVVLDEAAHAVRERVQRVAHEMIRVFEHEHIQAWLGKWGGLFARLLLTMHVCECAERGVYPTDAPVNGALAAKVERLLCDNLLHHAIYFFQEMVDASQHHEHVKQVARLIIVKGWAEVSRRDLQQLWKQSRKLDEREMSAVLGALCHFDWLEPQEGAVGHDGRPNRWHVNPQVHEMFAAQAEADRERRATAVRVLRELRAGRAANAPKPEAA